MIIEKHEEKTKGALTPSALPIKQRTLVQSAYKYCIIKRTIIQD